MATVEKQNTVIHSGGCHCGKICFEVRAPAVLECIDCKYELFSII